MLLGCQKPQQESAAKNLEPNTMNVQPAAAQNYQTNNDISTSRENAITRAVFKVSNATCGINVIQMREYVRSPFTFDDDPFFRFFFPEQTYLRPVKSLGSGFLISNDGYILTNEHVVHNASEIVVTLPDGSQHNAEVVGSDFITDIALLKISGDAHPYVQFGDSEQIVIGEWAIAVGNPFGLFEINAKPTVTVGVISAVDRDFGRLGNDRVYQDMIQTDAAINQGNSGGPLVNSLGEVIGMNTFIYTGSQYSTGSIGLGFAIPINRIKRVLDDLKQHGRVNRRWTSGLKVEELTPLLARYFRLKSTNGVIVTEVDKNSPAAQAGLEVGDIVTKVNDNPIKNSSDIWRIIEESDLRGGDLLQLTVLRDSRTLHINLKLQSLN